MRSKLPWFLLAISLAFNVFFLAGLFMPQFMGHHRDPGGHWDRMAEVTRELSLDEGQVAALEALRGRIAERRDQGREERDGFRAVIVDALSQPRFDREALAAALAERRSGAGDMILDMTEELHGFVMDLSPDQRAAFLERCRDRDFLRRLLFSPRPRD
jgi:uncharacterized membrane protein